MNLRELVLSQDDIVYEQVEVPEWKGEDGQPLKLTVRSLYGEERDSFEESLQRESKKLVKGKLKTVRKLSLQDVRARLVVLAVCVAPGNPAPLLSATDVAGVTRKNGKALDRLYEVASRLAGLTDEDIEELTGN